MPDYPWYEEVKADEPLTQGDFVERCPISVIKRSEIKWTGNSDDLVEQLRRNSGIELQSAIIMSQACDLKQDKIPNVNLCPRYSLVEYRKQWDIDQTSKGQNPTEKSFEKEWEALVEGRRWNLSVLNERSVPPPALAIGHQVIDFHEIFSLPTEFLRNWAKSQVGPRLRLLPPYREHLSQAFARFFMRVGLPTNLAARDSTK